MMGPGQVAQGALFYEFSIEKFVPVDHPLRGIDRFFRPVRRSTAFGTVIQLSRSSFD